MKQLDSKRMSSLVKKVSDMKPAVVGGGSESDDVLNRMANLESAPVRRGRPRGRPQTNPIRVKPLLTPKDVLPAERLLQDSSTRPLIWKDLPLFADRHGRSSMEMMYDLGFNTTYQYTNSAKKAEIIPFDLELLVRIFDAYPSSCPWNKTNPGQALDSIYGDLLEPYANSPEDEANMRMVIGQRLAAILDRSVTVLYRWLTDMGASSRRVINILSKVEQMGSAPLERRKAFEAIALPAWKLRGIDIDQIYHFAPKIAQARHMKTEVRQRMLEAKTLQTFQTGVFG